MGDSRRSRDPEAWRRQLSGLARNNPKLQDALGRGELPGFAGPLEGTEHLDPEAAEAAAANPPPPPPPAAPAAVKPEPARPALEVGTYQEPPHGHPPDPEPAPEPEPEPPRRRGPLGGFADGFLGRL